VNPLPGTADDGDDRDGTGELRKLAELVNGSKVEAVVRVPEGGRARMQVRNRHVTSWMLESIYAAPAADRRWWFWWGWSDPIAPVTDLDAAARKVTRAASSILDLVLDPGGPVG
jgi:hypothetical protein